MAGSEDLPLAGIRVLDGADEKGELCGRILCDLGARVLRMEPPRGAISRRLPPFAPESDQSLYFAVRNAGKLGITLDIESEGGRELLHRLLDQSDIWIDSTLPGTLEGLGLGPREVSERHPELVLTRISDFGQDGPYRDFSGTDMIGFAMGGMMYRAGAVHRPPIVAPGALAYDSAAITAAFATLLGYWQRLHTGRGQTLDLSVQESVANMADWSLPSYSVSPQYGGRDGAGIYALLRCADGFVRVIVLVKHHWRALLDWMGHPEELSDPALDEFLQRLIRRAEIEPVIEAFFRNKKKIDVAVEAQRRGITIVPMLEPSEILENPHTQARGTFRALEIADGLKAQIASGFLQLDGRRVGPERAAPGLGEHNAEIYAGELGLDDAALAALRAEGATKGDRETLGDSHARALPPLAGLRVLDFGVGAVGVEVGRLFAEYGADVIKIESRTAPDFIRTLIPGPMNPPFASSSRSKRSFGVDLKTRRGVELLEQLVPDADLLIDNSGEGVMERLGLGFERLRELNPRLVVFTSQIVGAQGPWKKWTGYGPSTHAVSGLQYLWNYPEDRDQPAGSTNIYPDHLVGRVGALAALAGLIQRERSGRGALFDAAQFETPIQLLADWFALESLAPGSVGPQGNRSSRGAPWGCYPCAGGDEWCVINVRSDDEWRALSQALADPAPDWVREVRFDTAAGRIAHADALDVLLSEWTAERTPQQVRDLLQAAGIAAGDVQHPAHQLADPQLAARGYARVVDQPGLGTMLMEGPAFRGTELPEPRIEAAPLLGEHTREIARERLGLSDSEIDQLVDAGVLQEAERLAVEA